MSDRKYTLPGMPDWNFRPPTLGHKGGAGFPITVDTSAQEVAEAVKDILRGTTWTPDEAAFEVVAQAALNINWQAMLDPYAPLIAPLLNAAPAAQQAIPPGQLDKIYNNLETAYYAIKASDPRGKKA